MTRERSSNSSTLVSGLGFGGWEANIGWGMLGGHFKQRKARLQDDRLLFKSRWLLANPRLILARRLRTTCLRLGRHPGRPGLERRFASVFCFQLLSSCHTVRAAARCCNRMKPGSFQCEACRSTRLQDSKHAFDPEAPHDDPKFP